MSENYGADAEGRMIQVAGKQFYTKDSGRRESFPTGAKRDTRAGKGRFDLIPPSALIRLAGVYERGAEKYGDNNWRKGMPFSRFVDSATRHLMQWRFNEENDFPQDEDHLAQAVWNLMAIMELDESKPELNDLYELANPEVTDGGSEEEEG